MPKNCFTHKGSGTLVRRGEQIIRATTWKDLDLPRTQHLIQSASGVPDPPLLRNYPLTARLCQRKLPRAAVILTKLGNVPYLDKFAVLDDAQGRPQPCRLEHHARRNTPTLLAFPPQQPSQCFYYAESDGYYKQDHWKIFLEWPTSPNRSNNASPTAPNIPNPDRLKMSTSPSPLALLAPRHAGAALITLLTAHPAIELIFVSSREYHGQPVAAHNPTYHAVICVLKPSTRLPLLPNVPMSSSLPYPMATPPLTYTPLMPPPPPPSSSTYPQIPALTQTGTTASPN